MVARRVPRLDPADPDAVRLAEIQQHLDWHAAEVAQLHAERVRVAGRLYAAGWRPVAVADLIGVQHNVALKLRDRWQAQRLRASDNR